MAARTYLPTFRILLHTTNVYAVRWQQLMIPHLTEAQKEALEAFLTCIAALITLLGPEPTPE